MSTQEQRKIPWVPIALVCAVLLIGLAVLMMRDTAPAGSEELVTASEETPKLSDEEADRITQEVRELLLLPSLEEERPLVARIDRADVLVQDQAFYQDVEDGDYLMIYPSLSKAVIYRSQERLLVNVGPIQIDMPPVAEVNAGSPEGR